MDAISSRNVLQKRSDWIDYDRGLSIILVSFRHAFESISNSGFNMQSHPYLEYTNVFLFGFRMPLFFIASGMFLSSSLQKKGLNGYAHTRVDTILYPMLIWGIIQLSLQLVFNNFSNSGFHFTDYVWLILDPRKTGQFWYLNALFCVGLLYAILKTKLNFNNRQQLLLGLTMYFFVAYLRSLGSYWGFIMDILQYYLFFCIGDLISSTMRNEKNQGLFSSTYMLFALVPVFLITQYNFTAINMENKSNYYIEHHMPLFYLFVALVGCAISINISFMLSKFNKWGFLKWIGVHSIHIYCMQIIIMAVTRLILIKLFKLESIPLLTILVLIAGVILPIFAHTILMRYNCWWLFSFKKPASNLTLSRVAVPPLQRG
jgi:fucose 4-O-acetylase-like acetyltransferase